MDMDTSKQGTGQLYPWLVIQDANDKNKLIYYDITSKNYSKKIFEEKKEICCCGYGWFILQDSASKNYCLFNPITLDMIQLPTLPKDNTLESYIFLPPTDPNCHVIFFDRESKTLYSCKHKDSKFIKQQVGNVQEFAIVDGKGYAKIWDKDQPIQYATFTFESEGSEIQFERLTIDDFSFKGHGYTCGGIHFKENLVELGGELLSVKLLNFWTKVCDIVIFKLDTEKGKWIEIDNIGHSTIFISPDTAIACNALEDSAVQKNSVYFFLDYERFFHVFSLTYHTFSKILPCPIISQNSTFYWMLTDMKRPI